MKHGIDTENNDFPCIGDFVARRAEDKNLFKEAVKEAAKEWLDDQYRAFGKWSAFGIAAAVFALLVKLMVINGLIPKG